MDILQEISENLQKGKNIEVANLVKSALSSGINPKKILDEGMIAGMNIIGIRFKNNEIYIPEVLIAARAMYAGLDILRPLLSQTNAKPVGRVIIGTVKGDIHDIGKNIVKMMMEGAGFEVIDLGNNVSEDKFVEAVNLHSPDIVAMSAMLSTTMTQMKSIMIALKNAGIREKIMVMIGGAPITKRYAEEIGADGYGRDATEAVEVAKNLLNHH